MAIKNISNLSTTKLSYEIQNGNISIHEVINYYFKQIKEKNSKLNAFITLTEISAYNQANILEKNISKNKLSSLCGIPFSIKDIIYAKNVLCTAGSGKLFNKIPSKDSIVVKNLKKSGAILLGTNTLNKFASGITGINSICGNSKNPWDSSRLSGGSSGGSAVAVSSGMIPFAIGTDTGGSIRVPASLCGVSGFKPTYNLINNKGVIDLSPSLDHIGILSKDVSDIPLILKSLLNDHKRKILKKYHNKKIKKSIVIAIPINYFFYLESDIDTIMLSFINILKNSGIKVVNINIENHDEIEFAWSKIRFVESSYIHTKILDDNLNKYGNDLKKMIEQGKKISGIDYISALYTRDKIKKEFLSLFKKINFLLLPTTIIASPKFTENTIVIKGKKFSIREALLRNNILFNLIGFPSLSIPIGFTKNKLPFGLQIVGHPFDDYNVLNFGNVCQRLAEKFGIIKINHIK